MNVPMFDVAPQQPERHDYACGAIGPPGGFEGWVLRQQPSLNIRRPKCNRMPGHEGPHRVYDRKARIRSEWPVPR